MTEPILELQGVTKFYGRFKALDDLTVSVRPGAIGLLGPNGAGKSTLIKALLGLVRLTSGSARVLGLDARKESRRIRELVGYLPEDDCAIAGLQGVQSVALAGELGGLPAFTALRRAHEILDYVTLAEERYREVQTYSTGMRQKVKLAQALIHSPKLVFLDEPTNGLDPEGREKMLRLIRNLARKKGVSVVVSTHILSDIEACCDAALILGRGRLLEYDDLDVLQQSFDSGCRVRIDGDPERLIRELMQMQCCRNAEVTGDEVHVWGGGEDIGVRVFEAAQRCGAVVREVSASRTSLEDIFMKAIEATGSADHAVPLEREPGAEPS